MKPPRKPAEKASIGRPSTKVERTCALEGCGKPFHAYPSEIARGAGLYCSRECRQASRRDGAVTRAVEPVAAVARAEPKVELVCGGCGGRFRVNPHRDTPERQALYCSQACRSARGPGSNGGEVLERDCENCGEPFTFYASEEDPDGLRGSRRHCSRRCRAEARERRLREFWDRQAELHPPMAPLAPRPDATGEKTPGERLASLRGRAAVLGTLLDRELAKPDPDPGEVAWLRAELSEANAVIHALTSATGPGGRTPPR